MRIRLLALAAAAVLALPMAAQAWGKKSGGCDSGNCGGSGGHFGGCLSKLHNAPADPGPQKLGHGFFQPPFQAAPWYLYWPYDAHFQLPAPIGAPFQPPQNLNAPWNPYFPHPAMGLAGAPGMAGAPPIAPVHP